MKNSEGEGMSGGFQESEITLAERLLSHVPILIAYVNADLEFQYVNVAYSEWYETNRDDILGRKISDFLSAEEYAEVEPNLTRALAGEKVEYHRQFQQKSGGTISVFASQTPEFDETGAVKGLVITVQNVTEQITAKKESERKSREYQSIISATSDGFLQVDVTGHIQEANCAYIRRSGYSRDELLSMTIEDLEGLETNKDTLAHIQRIVTNGHDRFETVHIAKSGERWPVEVSTVFVDDDGGMFFSFLRDVSERKKREEQIRDSENKYRTLTESAPVGVIMQAANGQIVSCNPMAVEILDMSEDQLYGRTSDDPGWQAIHEDGTPFPGRNHPAMVALRTGKSVRNVVMGLQYLHETKWITINSEPVFETNSHTPRAVITTFADITETKHYENHLDLAKKEAERASRAKSEFLASMSHEFRTPLNAILGYAQMLKLNQEKNLNDHQHEYLDYIVSGGEHLLALVNDVLDLMHIEADRLSIFLEEVTSDETVEECLTYLRPAAQSRSIRFVTELENGCDKTIFTDRLRYRQVLINLISNAIKFNRDGGSVTVKSQEIEGRYCRLSVTDTGVGIDESRSRDLFMLFHRSDEDSRVASNGGSGVGLAVSKMLVERLGGRIGFTSKLGAGSTFWIDLPLKTNDQVIIWTEEYRVGVDAIDKDHQAIFALTNRASQEDLSFDDQSRIVEELVDYTHYHFRREEAIMKACGYPDLEEHTRRHHKLEAYVSELAREWRDQNDAEAMIRLRGFLRNWWSGHILQVDRTIAAYAHGKEVEIQSALESLPGNR